MDTAPIDIAKYIEWTVSSKKDRRWNGSGRTRRRLGLTVIAADKWIKKCKKKYGKPPADLTYKTNVA